MENLGTFHSSMSEVGEGAKEFLIYTFIEVHLKEIEDAE
jgi:hypothetical protein